MYRLLMFASFAFAVEAQSMAPTPEVTTASPLSAEQIQQHLLMGWALPEPGVGARPTRAAPFQPESSTAAHTLNAAQIQQHLLMGWALPEPGAGPRTVRAVPPPLIQQHLRMGWTLPDPGTGLRRIRAAPRAPPAHRAHGPRAPLLPAHYGIQGAVHRAPLH